MQEEFSYGYSLKRNTINIFGGIDFVMAEKVVSELQYLDDKFKRENVPADERVITIQIDSPGGDVSEGLAIYDTMKYVDAKIATVGLGMAASMGAFLLAAGTKGYRRITKNCEVLIHQPLGGVQGQATEIISAANHIKRVRELLNGIFSEITGKPVETIEKDTDRDNIMTAQEALDYGLVDYII